MLWLIITILAYFFLAISIFGDRFLLTNNIPNPKVYSFYVGILSIFVIIFIPFGFFFPTSSQIFLAFLTGILFILGLYLYYSLIREFEASRIAPAIGGMIPILVLFFVYVFSRSGVTFYFKDIVSFLLLISGSILIVMEKSKSIFGKSFLFSLGAAFYFALYFVLAKFVYTSLTFINGFIWIRIGSFLAALFFLLFKEVRLQIFTKPQRTGFKTTGIFIGNQIIGSSGAILQNWAIALAPLVYVAFINALQGVQYAFLLIFAVLLSRKFPQILKEQISKEVILQKIVAILLIGGGLVILALR